MYVQKSKLIMGRHSEKFFPSSQSLSLSLTFLSIVDFPLAFCPSTNTRINTLTGYSNRSKQRAANNSTVYYPRFGSSLPIHQTVHRELDVRTSLILIRAGGKGRNDVHFTIAERTKAGTHLHCPLFSPSCLVSSVRKRHRDTRGCWGWYKNKETTRPVSRPVVRFATKWIHRTRDEAATKREQADGYENGRVDDGTAVFFNENRTTLDDILHPITVV